MTKEKTLAMYSRKLRKAQKRSVICKSFIDNETGKNLITQRRCFSSITHKIVKLQAKIKLFS